MSAGVNAHFAAIGNGKIGMIPFLLIRKVKNTLPIPDKMVMTYLIADKIIPALLTHISPPPPEDSSQFYCRRKYIRNWTLLGRQALYRAQTGSFVTLGIQKVLKYTPALLSSVM